MDRQDLFSRKAAAIYDSQKDSPNDVGKDFRYQQSKEAVAVSASGRYGRSDRKDCQLVEVSTGYSREKETDAHQVVVVEL